MRANIENGWEERTVTVKREDLLDRLKANREKHRREYKEAMAGYQEMAREKLVSLHKRTMKQLEDAVAMVGAKIDRFDPTDPLGDTTVLISTTSLSLEVPRDHTRAYDIAIEMAEWEVNPTIDLKQSQFQCFVLDDWEWKEQFTKMSQTYSNVAVGAKR